MHACLPLLQPSDFPPIARDRLETLQVNLGYLCNQSCLHCHVNAGPHRREIMDLDTVESVLTFLQRADIATLDLTGGAPEMNPHFRYLVTSARSLGIKVMDRCNLTILMESGNEDLADFMAEQGVEIIASLPCYFEEYVDRQRGDGVFETSLRSLRKLNALGYGVAGSGLFLNLVYNPQGPDLPPAQEALEGIYREELLMRYGIVFNRLFALANMPIQRFGSTLISRGEFQPYLARLRSAYRDENLAHVMCRNLLSVDWTGHVHDCDFNQMLGLPLGGQRTAPLLASLDPQTLQAMPIATADHCYGCTAGHGSGCGGALASMNHA